MINFVNLLKVTAVTISMTLLCCCGTQSAIKEENDETSSIDISQLSPDNIVIHGKVISIFDKEKDISDKLGEAYADSASAVTNKIERKTVIYKSDEGNAAGLDYIAFSNCYQKYLGEEFVCFNGINGKSTKKEVADILGDNCISVKGGEQTDYFCYFLDGKEIDYSEVNIPEGFVDTMGVCPYGRAYCENLIEDGKAQYYIEWRFLPKGEYFDCICTLYQKE